MTDTFLPRLGGIELHVADLATRQRLDGHDVTVLTAERLLPELDPPGPVWPEVVAVPGIVAGLGGAATIASVLAGFRPEVVHAHLSVASPFTWAVLRATTNQSVVASMHSLLPLSPMLVRAGIRASRLPTGRIRFTAVSGVAARRLQAGLPPGQHVEVLHNGIDPANWRVPHQPSTQFRILSVGRLVPRKRPLALISALAAFARLAPDIPWSATLVGDGTQRRRIIEVSRALGIADRIRLPGSLDRSQIRQELGAADVLVAPANLESFGIAALEARCAGVPVIAMASSGVTEFITHEVSGLLADTDAGIAQALHRLAFDPVLASRIRQHDTSTPVTMAWDQVLAEHERLYRSVQRAGHAVPTAAVLATVTAAHHGTVAVTRSPA